jgi:hypothetical protein
LGYTYNYDYFNNRTFRVSYAQNLYDSTLDRSYEYDQVGRLGLFRIPALKRARLRIRASGALWMDHSRRATTTMRGGT